MVEDNQRQPIFVMAGREVFKYAVKAMEDAVRGLLDRKRIDA